MNGLTTLAWRPFLDPLDLHHWWFVLLIPLALGVAGTYKAVRVWDFKDYYRQTAIMTVQIVFGVGALAAGSYVFVLYVAPLILPK